MLTNKRGDNLKNRVVVTGIGVVSPVGNNKEEFWDNILAGRSGAGIVDYFDTDGLTSKIACQVKDFKPENYLDKKEIKRMDKFVQYATVAAKMAVDDSNIPLDDINKDRFGVILGTGIGGINTFQEQHQRLLDKGAKRVSPFFIPMMIGNMASGQVSMSLGAKGPNETIVTACASATNAIGEAFKNIQRGDSDIMITGGTEASITKLSMAGFCSMKALSTRNDEPEKASRPFDKDRDGFVIGEGSGVLLLESLDHALKRGANIYAEIIGYGMSADAYHLTAPAPEGEGAKRSMSLAIKDGGINPEDIDYINAHGTSTPYNDKFETEAIKNLFLEHSKNLYISSTKSMTGHLLGAAGGVEAIACALALKNGIIPPTINYENNDEECDLNYVPNEPIKKDIDYALSNSLGFGGHNATIALKRYQ